MTMPDTDRVPVDTADPAALLSLRHINKSFGAVHVLRDASLDAYAGQVTALVGDNGAGKSTLIKGIAGIYAFDAGLYVYDGHEVTVTNPKQANALGIEVVYQDLALCDNLDIVHNMFLGRELTRNRLLDESTMERRAGETLAGLSVRTVQSLRQLVASLSGGQRQTVAIARAVLWNSRLVILDEPTAALGVAQTEQVLHLVRQLADNGLAVILISHNMNEVLAAATEYVERLRGGDVGSVPAVLGLVALIIVFTILRPHTFTNAFNFANLINQGAAVIVIAMGLVFVLLLGEIDLSAGFAAGTSGAVMGIALTNHHWPWWLSILAGLVLGAVIGTAIGVLVARLGIPSFVVTLAAFLGLQGVLLVLIGEGGTIPVRNKVILRIMNGNLPTWLGWLLFALCVGGYALISLQRITSRRASGLQNEGTSVWAAKVAALVVLLGAATLYLSGERSRNPRITSIHGVPGVVPLLIVLLVGLTFVLTRTSFGRHFYAVGGNAEAARRAGINVARVRLSCFIICSTLAAVAGVLFASRDNSISPSTGGALTLLYAVGAAVIGGTSLFGGKGRVMDAILGGLVVAVINNGMGLLNKTSGVIYIVTGIVLLVAASVDALSRKRAAATGRV